MYHVGPSFIEHAIEVGIMLADPIPERELLSHERFLIANGNQARAAQSSDLPNVLIGDFAATYQCNLEYHPGSSSKRFGCPQSPM